MATTYYIHFGIDATQAEDGSRRVKRSLEDIGTQSEKTMTQTQKLQKALDDSGNAAINTQKMFDKMQLSALGLERMFIRLAGAISMLELGKLATDSVLFAAKVEMADKTLQVLANNMGMTAQSALKYRDALKEMNITTSAATTTTSNFIRAGLPLERLGEMGKYAQGLATMATGVGKGFVSSSEALDRFSSAVVRMNSNMLHNLGLQTTTRLAVQLEKEERGELGNKITQQEKRLILFNAAMKEASTYNEVYAQSWGLAARYISSMQRPLEELKRLFGTLFQPELTVMAKSFYETIDGLGDTIRDNAEIFNALKQSLWDIFQGLDNLVRIGSAYMAFMAVDKINAWMMSLKAAGLSLDMTTKSLFTATQAQRDSIATKELAITIETAHAQALMMNMEFSAMQAKLALDSATATSNEAIAKESLIVVELRQLETSMALMKSKSAQLAVSAEIATVLHAEAQAELRRLNIEREGILVKLQAIGTWQADALGKLEVRFLNEQLALSELKLAEATAIETKTSAEKLMFTSQSAKASADLAVMETELQVIRARSVAATEASAAAEIAYTAAKERSAAASLMVGEAQAAVNLQNGIGVAKAGLLTTAFGTMGKALNSLFLMYMAWEIGRIIGEWLNKFELVRKGGVLMVDVLIGSFVKIAYWAEMAGIALNKMVFGDDENNTLKKKMDERKAQYEADLKNHNAYIAEMMKDAEKDPTLKANRSHVDKIKDQAPPKLSSEDPKLAAANERRNAYNIAQREKYNKIRLDMENEITKQKIFLENSAAKRAIEAVKFEYDQKLITKADYLDKAYNIEKAANEKQIREKESEVARLKKAGDDAISAAEAQKNSIGSSNPKVRDTAIESINKQLIDAQQYYFESMKAQGELNKLKEEDRTKDQKYFGDKKLNSLALVASEAALQAALLEEVGLTREALGIRQEIDKLTRQPESRGVDALKDQLNLLKEMKAEQQRLLELTQLTNKNRVDEANIAVSKSKLSKSEWGFGAIDAQASAELEVIRAKYEEERMQIENKITNLQMATGIEMDGITLIRDAKAATLDEMYQKESAMIDALNEKRYFNQPKELAVAKAAALKADADYNAKSIKATQDSDKKINNIKEKNFESTSSVIKGLQKALTLSFEKQKQEELSVEDKATKSKLSMVSSYAGVAGEMFSALADTQDQTSRKGFETAKAFNIGAAVMSTAAAVMNALATVQPYPLAIAAAAMAAATGVIQIAKISSTSFGGGASGVSAPSGSISASSGGVTSVASTGLENVQTPLQSVTDSRTEATYEALIESTDNASLAIGRLAKTMDSIHDLFSEGGAGMRLATNAPGRNVALAENEGWRGGNAFLTSIGASQIKTFEALRSDLFSGSAWENAGKDLFQGATDFLTFGLGGSVFGGDWQTKDAGMQLSVSEGVINADNYISQKKDGGWFRSDKSRTQIIENENADKYFSRLIDPYITDIGNMARTLGTSLDLTSFSRSAVNIKTAGRSEEDIAKDLEAWTIETLQQLSLQVEGITDVVGSYDNVYETLIRMNDAFVTANLNFELIGKTALTASWETAKITDALVTLMGGAEKFGESLDEYFSIMFTDAEQMTSKAKQSARQLGVAFVEINTVLPELNATVPTTTVEFRNLVNSLDTTSEAGAMAFASLISLAPAFNEIIKYTEKLKEVQQDWAIRLERATGNDIKADFMELYIDQQKELKDATELGMDVTQLKIVQELEWANAVEEAMGIVKKSLVDLVDVAKQNATQLIDAYVGIANSLKGIISGPMAMLSPEDAYNQKKDAYTALVGKTDVASLQALPEAASAFLEASKGYNASGMAYRADYKSVTEYMTSVLGDSVKSSGDATITKLNEQISHLGMIKKSIEDGTTANNLQIASFMGTSSPLYAAIKAINVAQANVTSGISGAVNSAAGSAISTVNNPYTSTPIHNPVGQVPMYAQTQTNIQLAQKSTEIVWKRVGNMLDAYIEGVKKFVIVPSEMGTTIRYADGMTQIAEYVKEQIGWSINLGGKSVPSYAIGTSYVPKDMYANIHEGEIVMDRQSAEVLRKYGIPSSGAADNRGVEERLDRVVGKLEDVERKLTSIETKARLVANA